MDLESTCLSLLVYRDQQRVSMDPKPFLHSVAAMMIKLIETLHLDVKDVKSVGRLCPGRSLDLPWTQPGPALCVALVLFKPDTPVKPDTEKKNYSFRFYKIFIYKKRNLFIQKKKIKQNYQKLYIIYYKIHIKIYFQQKYGTVNLFEQMKSCSKRFTGQTSLYPIACSL